MVGCENNCVSECEAGWEEEGGKCYFFSEKEDVWTWDGAEKQCTRNHDSHLASVPDQQTDDYIARKLNKGEAIWIGAKQTFGSNNKGSWAWADGCRPWNYTSWAKFFNPDGVQEIECDFYVKSIQNIAEWRATKCDDFHHKQFRYVCSTSICKDGSSITPTKAAKDAKDVKNATIDPTTIVVATSVVVGILVLIVVAVFTFKKLKNRRNKPKDERTDINPLYGHYYKVDGERIDEGRVYAVDSNTDYYS